MAGIETWLGLDSIARASMAINVAAGVIIGGFVLYVYKLADDEQKAGRYLIAALARAGAIVGAFWLVLHSDFLTK